MFNIFDLIVLDLWSTKLQFLSRQWCFQQQQTENTEMNPANTTCSSEEFKQCYCWLHHQVTLHFTRCNSSFFWYNNHRFVGSVSYFLPWRCSYTLVRFRHETTLENIILSLNYTVLAPQTWKCPDIWSKTSSSFTVIDIEHSPEQWSLTSSVTVTPLNGESAREHVSL